MVISVGGDGSILDASVTALLWDIPLLGVNLGKVGYLSEVEPDNLDILARLFSGEYTVEEKMLLTVAAVRDGAAERAERLAVNDVIISHDTFLGIADFTLENSVGDCVKYRADGLILSTPAIYLQSLFPFTQLASVNFLPLLLFFHTLKTIPKMYT